MISYLATRTYDVMAVGFTIKRYSTSTMSVLTSIALTLKVCVFFCSASHSHGGCACVFVFSRWCSPTVGGVLGHKVGFTRPHPRKTRLLRISILVSRVFVNIFSPRLGGTHFLARQSRWQREIEPTFPPHSVIVDAFAKLTRRVAKWKILCPSFGL